MPLTRYENGELKGLEIYPVTLGLGEPEYRRGRPRLAEGDEGLAILERFRKLAEPFGTTMMIEDGKAVVQLA